MIDQLTEIAKNRIFLFPWENLSITDFQFDNQQYFVINIVSMFGESKAVVSYESLTGINADILPLAYKIDSIRGFSAPCQNNIQITLKPIK
jgi:hypothetical protein